MTSNLPTLEASNFAHSNKTLPAALRHSQSLRTRVVTYKSQTSFFRHSNDSTIALSKGLTDQREENPQTINVSDVKRLGTWSRCRSALGKAKPRLVSEDLSYGTTMPQAHSPRRFSLNLSSSKSRFRSWLQSTLAAANIPEEDGGESNEITSQNSDAFNEKCIKGINPDQQKKEKSLKESSHLNAFFSQVKPEAAKRFEATTSNVGADDQDTLKWTTKVRSKKEKVPDITAGSHLDGEGTIKHIISSLNLEFGNPRKAGNDFNCEQPPIESGGMHHNGLDDAVEESDRRSLNKKHFSGANPYVIALNTSTDLFVNKSADSGATELRHEINYMSSNDDSSFNDWKASKKKTAFRPLTVVKSSLASSWHFEWDGVRAGPDNGKALSAPGIRKKPLLLEEHPVPRQTSQEKPPAMPSNSILSTFRKHLDKPQNYDTDSLPNTRQKTLEALKRVGQRFSGSARIVSSGHQVENTGPNSPQKPNCLQDSKDGTDIPSDVVSKELETSLRKEVIQISRYAKHSLNRLQSRLVSRGSGENSIESIEHVRPRTATSVVCESIPQVSTLLRMFDGSWIEEKFHGDTLWYTLGLDSISQCRRIRQEFVQNEEFSQFTGIQDFLLAGYKVDGAFHRLGNLITEMHDRPDIDDPESAFHEDLRHLNDAIFQSWTNLSKDSNTFPHGETESVWELQQPLTKPERKALDKFMWVKVIRCQQKLVNFKTDPSVSNHQDLIEVLCESMEFSFQNYNKPARAQLSDYTSRLFKFKTKVDSAFSRLASLSNKYAIFLDYSCQTLDSLESLKRAEQDLKFLTVLVTHPFCILKDIGPDIESLDTEFKQTVPEMVSLAETAVISMTECANTFDQFQVFIQENYREGPEVEEFSQMNQLIKELNLLLDQMDLVEEQRFEDALIDLRSLYDIVNRIAVDYNVHIRRITNEVNKRLMKSLAEHVTSETFEPVVTSNSRESGQNT